MFNANPSFLLGHIFYSVILNKTRISLTDISIPRALLMACFTLYGAGFTYQLMTKTEGLIQCAIPIYSAALSVMFLLASLQKENALQFLIGAMLYVASDNLIGAKEFLGLKMPYLSEMTWGLYYVGQRAMASALMNQSAEPNALLKK